MNIHEYQAKELLAKFGVWALVRVRVPANRSDCRSRATLTASFIAALLVPVALEESSPYGTAGTSI